MVNEKIIVDEVKRFCMDKLTDCDYLKCSKDVYMMWGVAFGSVQFAINYLLSPESERDLIDWWDKFMYLFSDIAAKKEK